MTPWTERLRACMQSRAITQAQLARALGCTRGAVGHYVSGRRRPTLDQFAAIAEALGVSPAWLQYGESAGQAEVREAAADYRASPELRLRVVGSLGRHSGEARPIDWVVPAGAVAVRVPDERYAPRWRARDLLVLSPDPPPQAGEEVVVCDAEARYTPYVLRQHGERLVLEPLLPGAPTVVLARDAVAAVLRVVAILRDDPVAAPAKPPSA